MSQFVTAMAVLAALLTFIYLAAERVGAIGPELRQLEKEGPP